jgi:CubicO group peptidase (beta-lactamase class C family)
VAQSAQGSLVLLVPGLLAFMAASFAQEADVASLRQMYDGEMLPDVAVATLSHTERLLPVRVVHRGGPVRVLPRRARAFPEIRFEDHGRRFDLFDYLSTNRVAGILVLKNGEIALEEYALGFASNTRWASFSMAKSVASTLLGAALVDGYIASLDDPVDRYVPGLRGGAYDGVSIRHVLTMSSGVCWNETYTDPKSDRRKVLELQIAQSAGSVLRYMNSLSRCGQPGSVWNYNTGETYVLGAVIEGATHRPLADYLSDKIWSRSGMEQDATWWLESPNGNGWGGSGIGATLRDYGRFALIAADDGRVDGRSITPVGWFNEAGAAHRIGGKMIDYGYMWWIPPQTESVHAGAFEAIGIFGQFMYINPREHLVIVVLSARSKPAETGRLELDDDAFFAAVTSALH